MKNKKISSIVGIAVLISLGLFFLILNLYPKQKTINIVTTPKTLNPNTGVSTPINKTKTIETILEVNSSTYADEINKNISVYDFMNDLKNKGKIDFTAENYIGMGEFINGINGVKNSNTQSWIYYVNGKEAEIGVSNYKIKPGDVVSFKYEKSDY